MIPRPRWLLVIHCRKLLDRANTRIGNTTVVVGEQTIKLLNQQLVSGNEWYRLREQGWISSDYVTAVCE